MKYEYGAEYETNGEKPDLDDDVKVEVVTIGSRIQNCMTVKGIAERIGWVNVKSFRVLDDRYKPKEQDMNNDWYDKGELPPVGEKVIAIDRRTNADGIKCELRYISSEVCVLYDIYDDCEFAVHPCHVEFRPLPTETDKLVEQMERSFESTGCVFTNDHRSLAEHLIEQGYRKIKPMSEDDFVFEATGNGRVISKDTARQLYKAGCRFIDNGVDK